MTERLAALTYGKVNARFLAAVGDVEADSGDPSADPVEVPLTGTITFTPTAASIRINKAQPAPVTVLPAAVACQLDSDGYLSRNGQRGIWLIATDNTQMNPPSFQYVVTFSMKLNGVVLNYGSFPIDVPTYVLNGDGTDNAVDLTPVAPAASSKATLITQGPPGPPGPLPIIAPSSAVAVSGDGSQESPLLLEVVGVVKSVNSLTPDVNGNVDVAVTGGSGDLSVHDNGDGTFSLSGDSVVDNGDGTYSITY